MKLRSLHARRNAFDLLVPRYRNYGTAGELLCRLFAGMALLFLAFATVSSLANDEPGLSDQVQTIKQQTLELNRDLFVLEEELLFPDNTQVAVFLSLDVGEFFTLDAVKLSIDGEVVSNYLYTARQVDALRRGGVHRLYQGNLKAGAHEIVAVFTGRGPNGRDYRRGTELVIDKTSGAKHLELTIVDELSQRQPSFAIKEW
ncbi:MAG: AraC family transcriptional regulator [Pseudomonadota bacterium]